jgi:hypothetical protein
MRVSASGSGLLLIAGLAFNASCGSPSSDNFTSSAGPSGAGGSSFAGASSNGAGAGDQLAGGTSVAGGSSIAGETSVGGSGNLNQGGASAGEAAANGGAGLAGAADGGATASGGTSGTNPADCPPANLAPNAICTPLANALERCVYLDESCRCRAQGGGNNPGSAGGTSTNGRWTCNTVCPATKPSAGEACTPGQACPYAGGPCLCGTSMMWQCPASDNNGAGGMSMGSAGDANSGTVCPMQRPRAGGMCSGAGLCSYGNGTACICWNNSWLCG